MMDGATETDCKRPFTSVKSGSDSQAYAKILCIVPARLEAFCVRTLLEAILLNVERSFCQCVLATMLFEL